MSLSHEIYADPLFAAQYASMITDNPWNACYERPASLSLLPDALQGKRLLDAGCGPGIVTRMLIDRQAVVTAIDYSPEMVALTNARTGHRAIASVHDLNNGLPQFTDAAFDIIYCSLVIHYLDDLPHVFSEFARVLSPGGLLIFSTDHPQSPDMLNKQLTGKEKISVYWSGFDVHMDIYQRPWAEIEQALQQNGFKMDMAITPTPTADCELLYPKEYAFLKANPHFICVRAHKLD
ncbi:class I SAM-dependent methyltransferase [Chitinophaga rhizophila]|uniref:Class I SAM-dependent methyltransferase n=1 Tax=Chitinophaga rhizophila TaxID=2866212 RepID=A0ABS7GIU1_9BACT|nr:class I SAM-dependent methyltransferase [Chitinophaga rhizophila]MBW8687065.1 class I SAM-dependent methyltransferase [Chitinophaga rhizophila]